MYDPLDNLREADQGARQFRYFYNDTGPSPTWRLASIKNPGGTTLNSFTYDVRGNTLQRNTGDAFTFDRANRLLSATQGASSYQYDALGRRVRETSNGLASWYQYSRAGQLLYTDDAKTGRTHVYIYLSGSLVAKRTTPYGGTPSTNFQHTDALGSLVAASGDGGVIGRRERMTAYGEPADGVFDNGHGYTGHQNDAATELVYMQQRYYDPAIGRFLSVDPMASDSGNGANFNRFYYASSNPFGRIDPDGREPTEKPDKRALCNNERRCDAMVQVGDVMPEAATEDSSTKVQPRPEEDIPAQSFAFADGAVRGAISYGKGLSDLARHLAAKERLLGPTAYWDAVLAEGAAIRAGGALGENFEDTAKAVCQLCSTMSPTQEANFKGRIFGRSFAAMSVTYALPGAGPALAAGAVLGNVVGAGMEIKDSADMWETIIVGEPIE